MILSSCASGNATFEAVTAASQRLQSSFQSANAAYDESPMTLRMRYAPLECDEKLVYEAQIYGAWRHVDVVGDADALDAFEKRLHLEKMGKSLEVPCTFTDELYASPCGQQFYSIQIE